MNATRRRFRRWWRKTTPLVLCPAVAALFFIHSKTGNVLAAIAEIWIMTLPCGIAIINKRTSLWIARQIYFGGLAAINIVRILCQ